MHSPEHAEEVTEARRLGGLRRRREVAITGAYDLGGLESVADIRRLIEIAVLAGMQAGKQASHAAVVRRARAGGDQPQAAIGEFLKMRRIQRPDLSIADCIRTQAVSQHNK